MVIYYIPFGKRRFKNYFLLFSSIIFYAWGEPVYVFLMIISIVIAWLMGLWIGRTTGNFRKAVLILAISYNLINLFIFKYLTFVSRELKDIFGLKYSIINISLPIGISFFTFQIMSYLFDVYYGKTKVQRNLLYVALYVSLFPQLIAGPIVRYETICDEINNRKETEEDFQKGIKRFVMGLGKKALIADFFAVLVNYCFTLNTISDIGLITAWIGAVAYTLEIYFDFSGYSDMAIGLGNCFGFHFKENFNYPYMADSINDFWKRWHISLTDWFRDYVYIPLGGNRVNIKRNIMNIIVVWVLTGVWHGANWTFLIWGLIYCVFQLLEKFCYSTSNWPKVIRHIYTLLIVCVCWVIFRADNVGLAVKYIVNMFGRNGIIDESSWLLMQNSIVIFTIGILFSLPIVSIVNKKCEKLNYMFVSIKESLIYVFLCFVVTMTAALSISGGYSQFIYFNF
jgi:D-alanyl-lipoteichoic acid acyltransferase DltB (MBOAT superfamily)